MNDETKARGTVLKGLTLATGISLFGMAAAAGQDHSEKAAAFVELANKQVSVRFDAANGAVASVSNRVLGVAYTVNAPAPSLFELMTLAGQGKTRLQKVAPAAGSLRRANEAAQIPALDKEGTLQ